MAAGGGNLNELGGNQRKMLTDLYWKVVETGILLLLYDNDMINHQKFQIITGYKVFKIPITNIDRRNEN